MVARLPMKTTQNDRALLVKLEFGSRLAGAAAALLGASVLLGWFLGVGRLTDPLSILPMKPNTALCFVLLGSALAIGHGKVQKWPIRPPLVLAGLATLLAGLTALQSLFGWDLHIDEMLVAVPRGTFAGPRMAFITASTLSMLGTATLLSGVQTAHRQRPSEWLASVSLFLPVLGIADYALDWTPRLTGIAIHTAIGLLALGLSVLTAYPGEGWMKNLTSERSGAVAARRLLPIAVIAPLILGALRWRGQQAGLYSTEAGVVLMICSTIILLVPSIWWSAWQLNRSEERRMTDRDAAERDLRFANERLSLAHRAGQSGSFDWDIQRNINVWSSEIEILYGLQPGEFGGTFESWESLVFPEDLANAKTAIAASLQKGEFAGEWRIRRRSDDQLRWLEAKAKVLFDDDGRPTRMIGINWDITERKLAEDAIRISEQKFRTLVENLPQRIAVKDRNSTYVSCNENFARDLGIRAAEVAGKTDFHFFPAELAEKYRADDTAVMNSGQAVDLEETYSVNGSRADVQTIKVPFRDDAGALNGVLIVFWDITQRKNAERQLKEAALYSRTLLEASLDPLVTINKEGLITDVNQAAEAATGCDRERLIGSEFCGYFTQPQIAHDAYRLAFARGTVRGAELSLRHSSGRITDVVYNATVYRDPQGEVKGVFAAARDITERKRAEAALAKRTAELERSNKELQDFASIASHDLQEPLRKIQAFGDRLRARSKEGLDEVSADYLSRMQNAADRMSSLIEGLLMYSRVATKAQPFETVNLSTVTGDVLIDLEERVRSVGAVVDVGPLPTIQADKLQMRQLIQNLLSNALKFHKPGTPPKVKIASGKDGHGMVTVTVEDDGVGFDDVYGDRIFRPFQRLHGRHEFEGSGMGLAICRKIVERHQGTIRAQARAGLGAAFTFTIPEALGRSER